MKPLFVGFILMVLVCTVGIASAASSGDTPVSGTVDPLTLTLTAPSAITDWELERGACNQNDFPDGSLVVSTNDETGVPCVVTVTTDNSGLMYFPPDIKGSYLQTPLNIWDGVSWQSLGSTVSIFSGTVGDDDVNIPVHLQQCVTSTDVGHDYTIKLTFTLSQV